MKEGKGERNHSKSEELQGGLRPAIISPPEGTGVRGLRWEHHTPNATWEQQGCKSVPAQCRGSSLGLCHDSHLGLCHGSHFG